MRKKCISMVLAVLVTLSFFTIMPIAKADVYSLGSLTFSEAYQNNFDGATDQSVQNEFTVLGGAPENFRRCPCGKQQRLCAENQLHEREIWFYNEPGRGNGRCWPFGARATVLTF